MERPNQRGSTNRSPLRERSDRRCARGGASSSLHLAGEVDDAANETGQDPGHERDGQQAGPQHPLGQEGDGGAAGEGTLGRFLGDVERAHRQAEPARVDEALAAAGAQRSDDVLDERQDGDGATDAPEQRDVRVRHAVAAGDRGADRAGDVRDLVNGESADARKKQRIHPRVLHTASVRLRFDEGTAPRSRFGAP